MFKAKLSSRHISMLLMFGFGAAVFGWASWLEKEGYLNDEHPNVMLALAPVGVVILWLLLWFALVETPGFKPHSLPNESWDVTWQRNDDFLRKPSTKLIMLLAPITLWFYLIKWGLTSLIGKFRSAR